MTGARPRKPHQGTSLPSLPMGGPNGGSGGGSQQRHQSQQYLASRGFSRARRLRNGTEFPGMDTNETGISDAMTDYARMKAAGGA